MFESDVGNWVWHSDALAAIEQKNKRIAELEAERDALKAALVQIAAYAEGPVVNSGFDEPAAAQTARNALDAAKHS